MRAKDDGRQWFLRTGGETVFGPVSTQGLVMWAEQGRILPGHEVSTDRKKWVQAVSVELLDMRWFVDDGGELRGPLNRLAAEALIKSGKVAEGAQLVPAEEIEAPSEESAAASPAPAENGGGRQGQVPEDVLRVRVRELEGMVNSLRERLTKVSGAEAIETVQHERDVLAALVKEMESQRDSVLRNAEKDSRAGERKQEQLRQQIRKLEQQLEETTARLPTEDSGACAGVPEKLAEMEQAVAQARSELEAERVRATHEQEVLRSLAEAADRRAEEAAREREEAREACEHLRADAASRVAALEQAVQFHERREAEAREILGVRESELEAARARGEADGQRMAEAEARAAKAEARAAEQEAAFAELLNDANARDVSYAEKIAALEKACAQSPEETARFFADQTAVYGLMKAEAEELFKAMEEERRSVEQLKEWSVQRQQALATRRQSLLARLGDSPVEMTRRTLRESPSDPNAVRLRTEYDNLLAAHQRDLRLTEDRERDLQRKLRVLESEVGKLRAETAEGEKVGRLLQDVKEQLRRREQELFDERKNRDAEREQFQGNQQALLLRIESLEKTSRPTTPDEAQTAEARNVKIATWMRLKK